MARKVSDVKKKKVGRPKGSTNAPKRATSSRLNSSKANSSNAYERRYENRGISTIIFFCAAVLFCLSMWTPLVGILGSGIRGAFLFFFGRASYIFPLLVFAFGFFLTRTKNRGMFGSKYWMFLLLLISISAFWFSLIWGEYSTYTIYDVANIYGGAGGGLLGTGLGKPIILFMSQIGAAIILIALIAILTTVVFNLNWIDIFEKLTSYIHNRREEYKNDYYDNEYVPEEMMNERIIKKANDKIKELEKLNEKKNRLPIFNKKERSNNFTVEVKPAEEDSVLPKKTYATVVPASTERNRITASVVTTNVPWEERGGYITPATVYDRATATAVLEKVEEEIEEKEDKPKIEYVLPPLNILTPPDDSKEEEQHMVLEKTAKNLLDTLDSFGVGATITDYSLGPSVTRYELKPDSGVKISKIRNLEDDIALNLAASGVRIEAPIPGKAAVGIEIPNKVPRNVNLSEVVGTVEFENAPSKISFALGQDISGAPVICDIARMPHLLIAGSTGSGKSVCINTIINSLLYKSTPEEVKMILIDPKMVELGGYNGIPHLLIPVVTDPHKAAGALAWAVKEMTKRYKTFAESEVRDLKGYNAKMDRIGGEKLPQVVIIIDELADLMMVAPNDVEDSICRLAQLARAAGMHLVIATQRPSVDVITGVIKANIPSRIAFAVSSQVDSRTILDGAGAEKLIGRGDMLYNPIGANKPIRVQGCFISDKEIKEVVKYAKQFTEEYDDDVQADVNSFELSGKKGNKNDDNDDDGDNFKKDELLSRAIEIALDAGQASVSMYQRLLGTGYQRAAKIIDQMERLGVVGAFEGTKPRKIIITRQHYMEMLNSGII